MRRTIIAAILVVAAIAGGYMAGYVPESRRRMAAEAQVAETQAELSTAAGRLRSSALLGQVLTLKDVAVRQNYGEARELSSAFFDAVRKEAASVTEDRLRNGLSDILARRDAVTAALANGDPSVTTMLYEIERRLRDTLGYPVPPSSTDTPGQPG